MVVKVDFSRMFSMQRVKTELLLKLKVISCIMLLLNTKRKEIFFYVSHNPYHH